MQRFSSRAHRPKRLRRAGYTLVDLAMAVAIIGIIAAVATPKMSATLDAQRAQSAARRIATDLEFARQRAIATSAEQVVRFTLSTSAYTIDGLADPAHPGRTYSVALTESTYSSTLLSTTLGSSGELRFRFTGLPNQAASIVVKSGAAQRTISVDATTGKGTIL